MNNTPILRYNDLGNLMYLTHEHHLNGVVVDDAALEVMLRIEKTMQRLEVMGDDEQRWLWIELKAPGKRNREITFSLTIISVRYKIPETITPSLVALMRRFLSPVNSL